LGDSSPSIKNLPRLRSFPTTKTIPMPQEETGQFPPQMPTPHPMHMLAGQSANPRSAGMSKQEQHARHHLRERRLRWLGHIRRMNKGCISENLLYGELAEGTQPTGRSRLHFKDACKRKIKICHIDTNTWEACADDVRPGDSLSNKERKGVKKSNSRRHHCLLAVTAPEIAIQKVECSTTHTAA